MSDKLQINPALIAALDHYADGKYNPLSPSMFVYKSRGRQEAWTIEKTCGLSSEALQQEGLAYLELKILKEGLKKHGMECLYQAIMGRDLDA